MLAEIDSSNDRVGEGSSRWIGSGACRPFHNGADRTRAVRRSGRTRGTSAYWDFNARYTRENNRLPTSHAICLHKSFGRPIETVHVETNRICHDKLRARIYFSVRLLELFLACVLELILLLLNVVDKFLLALVTNCVEHELDIAKLSVGSMQ